MKRSEVMAEIYKAEIALDLAKNDLEYWLEELKECECDHPEFADHVCDHCGAYVEYSEEALQALDDFNVLVADYSDGVYPDAAFDSPYFQWPLEREQPEPQEDGDYLDSLETWQTYGPDA